MNQEHCDICHRGISRTSNGGPWEQDCATDVVVTAKGGINEVSESVLCSSCTREKLNHKMNTMSPFFGASPGFFTVSIQNREKVLSSVKVFVDAAKKLPIDYRAVLSKVEWIYVLKDEYEGPELRCPMCDILKPTPEAAHTLVKEFKEWLKQTGRLDPKWKALNDVDEKDYVSRCMGHTAICEIGSALK